jgi:Cu-processing system permease protein
MYGLTTVFPEKLANAGVLGGVMVLWIVMPLIVAVWRFRK